MYYGGICVYENGIWSMHFGDVGVYHQGYKSVVNYTDAEISFNKLLYVVFHKGIYSWEA